MIPRHKLAIQLAEDLYFLLDVVNFILGTL